MRRTDTFTDRAVFSHTGKQVTGIEFWHQAQTFVGTPYNDYGRVKGLGLDCIGLPILTGHELGLYTGDFDAYTPTPKKHHAKNMSDANMTRVWQRPGWPENPEWIAEQVPNEATAPGMVGLFWFSNRTEPQHFAVFGVHPYGPHPTMVHAHARFKKCVEQIMDTFWLKRMVASYAMPGVILDAPAEPVHPGAM